MRTTTARIAISGSHGTGKTTLLEAVARTPGWSDRVSFVREVPRRVVEMSGDSGLLRRGSNTFMRQTLLIAAQIEDEAMAANASPHRLILSDRSVVDHWTYTSVLFPDGCATPEGKVWENLVTSWASTYTTIIGIRPEFPVLDDGVREDDEQFQHEIDERLIFLYEELGIAVELVTGTVDQRLRRTLELIEAALGGET